MYNFDAKQTTKDCIQWIRKFFAENGPTCNAIVGISGGKDSSVVAALCIEALGKDRVIGVLMPNGEQADIDKSKELVDFLGIKHFTIDISGPVTCLRHSLQFQFGKPASEQTLTNLPARIRMATLYAVSQSNNGRVANTCNLSEDTVGYATRYGDGAGDFSPLSKLTVTEIKAMGYVLKLPTDLIEKIPIDGLCGKTDEENLGFSYAVEDIYIRTGVCEDIAIKEKIDTMHKKNKFKLELMPSFTPVIE